MSSENGGNFWKVRKRGGSSSSSSTVRSYRLKRAVSVGKMMNATTTSALQNDAKSYNYSEGKNGDKEKEQEKELLVSGRKLAANLWQINGENVERRSEVKVGRKERILKSNSTALQSGHSHGHVSQGIDTSKVGIHKTLQSDYSFESDCLMEARNRLKEVRHGLSTSKQLLEVLSHIWSLEEHQSSCVLSLFSALKTELDRAIIQVSKVMKEQKCSRGEIDLLMEQFEKEKAGWKMREEYRIQSAIATISGELEKEKKMRIQSERLNKKLGRELADTKAKASLLKATSTQSESESFYLYNNGGF